jgi:hypothetical protein
MGDMRSDLAKARDKWLASDEATALIERPGAVGVYLKNRLEKAFIAGWNAAKNISDFDERVWNRFFGFVFPDERDLPREQVQAELRQQGIDLRPARAKLASALKHARDSQEARAAFEHAKQSGSRSRTNLPGSRPVE